MIVPNTAIPIDPSKKPTVAKYSTGNNNNSKGSNQGSVADSMTSKAKSKSAETELGLQSNRQVTKRPDCIGVSHSLKDMQPNSPSWNHKNSVIEKCGSKGDQSTQGRSSGKTSPVLYTRGSLPSQRHSPYGHASHHSGSSSPREKTSTRDPLDSPTAKQLLAAALALSPKSPQHSNPPSTHNSPVNSQPGSPGGAPHEFAFQEENAFSMYPFEYGSFQDLPPAAFGKWCD